MGCICGSEHEYVERRGPRTLDPMDSPSCSIPRRPTLQKVADSWYSDSDALRRQCWNNKSNWYNPYQGSSGRRLAVTAPSETPVSVMAAGVLLISVMALKILQNIHKRF